MTALAAFKRRLAEIVDYLRSPLADIPCQFVPHFKKLADRSGKDRRTNNTTADDILYGVQRGADRRKS